MNVELEEAERIMRAAQAVRLGMNMHHNDTRPGVSFFTVFVRTIVVIIIGLMLIGSQSDKIWPLLMKWDAYQKAHPND